MPSIARTFYEDVLGQEDRFAYLASLTSTDSPTFETEWRDFKGKPQPKDIDKIWSEAASAFANTEGGVIIWGIDCRRIEGIDAASGMSLIENPIELKSKLNTAIHQTTDPPIQGIEIEAVLGPDGKGFVVCFVPEGSHKPYRAEQKTNKPYMLRAGDSFLVMSRSVLRSMFFPQASPNLKASVKCTLSRQTVEPRDPHIATVLFRVTIENDGVASAENLFLRCKMFSGQRTSGWDNVNGEWSAPHAIQDGWEGTWMRQAILHPSQSTDSVFIDVKMPGDVDEATREILPNGEVDFDFVINCKNQEPYRYNVTFSTEDIRESRRLYGKPIPPP